MTTGGDLPHFLLGPDGGRMALVAALAFAAGWQTCMVYIVIPLRARVEALERRVDKILEDKLDHEH